MGSYLKLLQEPGVLRITSSQLTARLPSGMLALAIVLHVHNLTGSYAVAGAVVSALSIGEAIFIPLTSRLSGRIGIRKTLITAAVLNAAALVLLALMPAEAWLLVALGFATGATVPPLMPVVRALYPRLVNQSSLPALFALDTTAQELIFASGPLIAAVLAAAISPSTPLLVSGAVSFLGTLWFISSPKLGAATLPRSAGRFGGVLTNGNLLVCMASSSALMASFMSMELGIVSAYEGHGVTAGVAIAISCVGSLVGGLVFGQRQLGIVGLILALLATAMGTALAGIFSWLPLVALALFVSGLGFAPALATLYLMVSLSIDSHKAAEAFGWVTTSSLAGAALGTSLAGIASESEGALGSYLLGSAFALVAAAFPVCARLRGPVVGLSRGY